MKKTFCGKDCESCQYREQIQCGGCMTGADDKLDPDCAVARCCRFRGHEKCEDCEKIVGCDTLTRCDRVAEQRVRAWEAEEVKRAAVREKAPFLAKWLWILFWVSLAQTILGQLGDGTLISLTELALSIWGIVVFWKLSAYEKHYRTAAICAVFTVAVGILDNLMANWLQRESSLLFMAVVIVVVTLVIALIGSYHRFKGHEAILIHLDDELADKWHRLWKWYIGALIAVAAGAALILIPELGTILAGGGAIITLVVSVLELVYLHKTAACFDGLAKSGSEPAEPAE